MLAIPGDGWLGGGGMDRWPALGLLKATPILWDRFEMELGTDLSFSGGYSNPWKIMGGGVLPGCW